MKLPAEERHCSACGKRLPRGASYCPGCGTAAVLTPDEVLDREAAGLAKLARSKAPPTISREDAAAAMRVATPMSLDPVREAVEFAESGRRQRATSRPEEPEWLHFEVRARQGEMATGKSFLRSMIGGMPAVIRCYFDLWSEDGLGDAPLWGVTFLINAGQAVSREHLSGMDRNVAQDALDVLDKAMIGRGCRRVADGPHWYSHRFALPDDRFGDFLDRLPS